MTTDTFFRALIFSIATASLVSCASAPKPPATADLPPATIDDAPAPPPIEPTADEWLTRGKAALEAGDLEGAETSLGKAAAASPELVEARFWLGQTAEKSRRFDKASGHYQELLERAPTHRPTLRALGHLLLTRTKDFATGTAIFERALASAPFDPEWLNAKALFLWNKGNATAAEETLRKLLARHPNNATAYETLTLIALTSGKRRLADLFSQRALELAPEDADAHHCRALFLLSALDGKGRAEAAFHLREAVRLNPALSEAWFNLGNLALEHRDYARAHEAFEHVRRLNPDQPDLPLRLAWTFEGLRDESGKPRLRDAVAHYEAQLMASEKDAEALLGLARLFEGPLKEADRALALYERAIEALKPGRRQKEVIEARDRLKQRVALEAEVRAQADQG